jgi:cytochrome P450
VDVCGVAVPKGGVVLCFFASANHDGRRWPRAEQFDVTRERLPHAAFGYGRHACLGMQLARAELAIGLTELLTAAPLLELAPAAAVPAGASPASLIRGLASRGPSQLPVVLAVATSASPTA